MIYLYNNRFTNIEQGLLGSIELDMNNKREIVYFITDYLLKANTFLQGFKNRNKKWGIGIKTRGYHIKRNEDNLLICTRLRRFSENSTTKHKLNNNQITSILETKGIKAIWAKGFSAETNARLGWKLDNL